MRIGKINKPFYGKILFFDALWRNDVACDNFVILFSFLGQWVPRYESLATGIIALNKKN